MRAAIQSLPWRERKVIGLYYYGEVTMKQIGAEIGVNESRVSQLHARAIRRLRDALGDMNPQKVAEMRRQLIAFAARKPMMAKAAMSPRRRSRRCTAGAGCRKRWRAALQGRRRPAPAKAALKMPRQRAGHRCRAITLQLKDTEVAVRAVLRSTRAASRTRSQQIPEPERLRQPAAAALLEKLLRVGAGHVAGDEDHALRQLRRAAASVAIERLAVEPRHLQIADDRVERLRR